MKKKKKDCGVRGVRREEIKATMEPGPYYVQENSPYRRCFDPSLRLSRLVLQPSYHCSRLASRSSLRHSLKTASLRRTKSQSLLSVRIGEPPGELATDDTGLVDVRADDGHRDEGNLVFLEDLVHLGAAD